MPTDRPQTPLTAFARGLLRGLEPATWSIVQAAEIEGGGMLLQGVVCWPPKGQLQPFTLTEGDGG